MRVTAFCVEAERYVRRRDAEYFESMISVEVVREPRRENYFARGRHDGVGPPRLPTPHAIRKSPPPVLFPLSRENEVLCVKSVRGMHPAQLRHRYPRKKCVPPGKRRKGYEAVSVAMNGFRVELLSDLNRCADEEPVRGLWGLRLQDERNEAFFFVHTCENRQPDWTT